MLVNVKHFMIGILEFVISISDIAGFSAGEMFCSSVQQTCACTYGEGCVSKFQSAKLNT